MNIRRGLMGVLGLGSALGGLLLIGIGIITRQERAITAGRRQFRGFAFERRWIADPEERDRHAEIVAERLDLPEPGGHLELAAAAARLGVTVETVRRRVKRGQLEGVYQEQRLVGVVLPTE